MTAADLVGKIEKFFPDVEYCVQIQALRKAAVQRRVQLEVWLWPKHRTLHYQENSPIECWHLIQRDLMAADGDLHAFDLEQLGKRKLAAKVTA